VRSKDVRLPVQLQRAMAAEAEASREARAKVSRHILSHCHHSIESAYDFLFDFNRNYVSTVFEV